jgi:DNA-binding MarR family transcriptional regulator
LSRSRRLPETSARRAPENLAILLREPFRTMSDELMERLAERGHPEVRFAHGGVFQFLDDDGTRVSVLAERAGVSKQAMAQLVAHLERHGYVERVPDAGDRRAKLVRATDRGREVFAVARELMADAEARLTERLGAAKLRRLRALLEELGAALWCATGRTADERSQTPSDA